MSKKILSVTFLFLIFLTLSAQVDTSGCKYRKPILGGHPYTMSECQSGSFINTHLSGSIGLGSTGTMSVPGLEIGDYTILEFIGELMFFSSSLEYQQKINDWLAMYTNFSLVGRIGSDVGMILVDGVSSLSGMNLGWLFRIYKNERFNLSGALFLQNMSGSFVDVLGYVNDIFDSVPNPRVVKKIPVMNGGAGFNAAWTLNKTVGFLLHSQFLYGESFTRGINSFFLELGMAGDIDFNPVYKVPLGLNVGYTYSSKPENTLLDFNNTNILHMRVAYTGACDFDVGLQFTFYRYELRNIVQRRPWVLNTSLGFNLFF